MILMQEALLLVGASCLHKRFATKKAPAKELLKSPREGGFMLISFRF